MTAGDELPGARELAVLAGELDALRSEEGLALQRAMGMKEQGAGAKEYGAAIHAVERLRGREADVLRRIAQLHAAAPPR